MANLKIKESGRNWWNRKSRRDIYINGKHSGVLTGEEQNLEVEAGPCKVMVQNTFPAFRSTAYINLEEKADNHVEFRDSRWIMNFLMALDLILMFVRNLLPVPRIFRNITNLYAMFWTFYSLANYNNYFKTFAYSRVAIDTPAYS